MPAYGDLDKNFAGQKYGLDSKQESWRAGEDINWGDPVFSYIDEDFSEGEGSVWKAKQDTSTITLDADLITDNVITTTITIDGVAQSPVATSFNTDHDTTMDDHVTDLEAAISGLTVTLTDSINNRQFTLLTKGKNIDLVTSVVTGGASQAGTTIAYTTSQVFIGVAFFTQISFKDDVGYYPENCDINVMIDGWIWVNTDDAVDSNTDAYVVWASGADQGKFTATATDNYDTKCRFRSTLTAAGIALIEVRGQQTDATP